MTCCSHQIVLHDKDIPVDDNTSGQKSVADVDEEAEFGNEVTEDPLTNQDNGENVADTEASVQNHHPVKESFSWLLHDELEKISIGCEYQHHTDQLTCSKYLCVHQIFIIIMDNMFNLINN